MSNCTSGCPTQDHATWGECMRAKGLGLLWTRSAAGRDATEHKAWNNRIREYRNARRQGIQPDSTKVEDVRRAVEVSNETGMAYQA